MKWNEQQLLSILPHRLRGADFRDVRELRLRPGQKPRLVTGGGYRELGSDVTADELRYVRVAVVSFIPRCFCGDSYYIKKLHLKVMGISHIKLFRIFKNPF